MRLERQIYVKKMFESKKFPTWFPHSEEFPHFERVGNANFLKIENPRKPQPSRVFAVYSGRESNPHSLNGNRILSPHRHCKFFENWPFSLAFRCKIVHFRTRFPHFFCLTFLLSSANLLILNHTQNENQRYYSSEWSA